MGAGSVIFKGSAQGFLDPIFSWLESIRSGGVLASIYIFDEVLQPVVYLEHLISSGRPTEGK